MALSLKSNLSSDYLKASQSLYSKKERKCIVAYVESYDDVSFWRNLLEKFETDEYYFRVMLPSSKSLTKGKKIVLFNTINSNQLGDSLIACVDGDYDYLLQDTTPISREINTNRFIFHTYAYAIENYFCFADSLHEVSVQATLNDNEIFNFKEFLSEYSTIVYPLFLWTIYFARSRNASAFPMSVLSNVTRINNFNIKNPEASLRRLEEKVDQKLVSLERSHPSLIKDVQALAGVLSGLGVTRENTYLFMQGHHVLDHVVIKILKPVCLTLIQQRENYIKRLAVHKEQYNNELTAYQNSLIDIELALKRNFGFDHLFTYNWLQSDVERFMNELNQRKSTDK